MLGLLTGCAVGPDYNAPDNNHFLGKWFSSSSESGQHSSQDEMKMDWWAQFNDPLLEEYIGQAAQENKNLKAALFNVRRARALKQVETSSFIPQLAGDSGAERGKSSGSTDNSFNAGFDASWEIDVFGGNRRALEAASARLGSAQESYNDVLLSVLSDVARNYYEARGLQKRIAITKTNADLLKQTMELVQARMEVGEASEFDLSRARGEYQLTLARVPNYEAELKASIYALSVLLGQPPETLLEQMMQVKPLPTPPDIVPVGLRSDILRRRPDIRIAERELAAETADIGVATAELFPKFFLTGSAGGQAATFGDVFSAAGQIWSLAGIMQWSVFEGGANRARIRAAEAETQAALADYEQTVLEALADAETALARYGHELETRKRLEDGVRSRRSSVRLAKELFDAGEEDYLAVLDSERELTSSEDDLVVSETQSIVKLISLYTALGGGWSVYADTELE